MQTWKPAGGKSAASVNCHLTGIEMERKAILCDFLVPGSSFLPGSLNSNLFHISFLLVLHYRGRISKDERRKLLLETQCVRKWQLTSLPAQDLRTSGTISTCRSSNLGQYKGGTFRAIWGPPSWTRPRVKKDWLDDRESMWWWYLQISWLSLPHSPLLLSYSFLSPYFAFTVNNIRTIEKDFTCCLIWAETSVNIQSFTPQLTRKELGKASYEYLHQNPKDVPASAFPIHFSSHLNWGSPSAPWQALACWNSGTCFSGAPHGCRGVWSQHLEICSQ